MKQESVALLRPTGSSPDSNHLAPIPPPPSETVQFQAKPRPRVTNMQTGSIRGRTEVKSRAVGIHGPTRRTNLSAPRIAHTRPNTDPFLTAPSSCLRNPVNHLLPLAPLRPLPPRAIPRTATLPLLLTISPTPSLPRSPTQHFSWTPRIPLLPYLPWGVLSHLRRTLSVHSPLSLTPPQHRLSNPP